jgi:hypothetical protein
MTDTTQWAEAYDVPQLTHADCGNPLTTNPFVTDADKDALRVARNLRPLFWCRHCDGMPPQMPDGTTVPLTREMWYHQ